MIGQLCVNIDGSCSTLFVAREHLPLSAWAFCMVKARKSLKNEIKVYTRQWISHREERGILHQLIRELEVEDVVAYK